MLLLYEHPLSSYVQKVKIVLREKGLPFRTELPDDFGTGQADGTLAMLNPRAEVPVLVDGAVRIFESAVILDYLEQLWPEPPMLPPDAVSRAQARITATVCDTQYEAVNWGFGEVLWFRRADGALAEHLRAQAVAQTRLLQRWLQDRLGEAEWFGGDRFGWADAAVAPMVNRSVHFGMAPAPDSPLGRWHARLCLRPSVAATFAEFDKAAATMASASAHYTSGGRRREYRDHRLEWMIKSGGLSVVQDGLAAGNIRFPWPPAD